MQCLGLEFLQPHRAKDVPEMLHAQLHKQNKKKEEEEKVSQTSSKLPASDETAKTYPSIPFYVAVFDSARNMILFLRQIKKESMTHKIGTKGVVTLPVKGCVILDSW